MPSLAVTLLQLSTSIREYMYSLRNSIRACKLRITPRSTVDAMSEAIDQCEVMLYGVSLQYKESAYVTLVTAVSVYSMTEKDRRENLLSC